MQAKPYPRYKDSGVMWLGNVPEHWDVVKFSREVKIAEGQVDPEKEPYASMQLIGPEHVESGTGRLLACATAAEQAAESGKYLCWRGDVIYSKIRPALRKVVIAPCDCICSADMYPLRGRHKLQNNFIYWLFLSQSFAAWSVLESDRVAMPKINRDTINELRMPILPQDEQQAIAEFLDRETGRIDRLLGQKRELIERLKEKRTALISRTVTRGLPPGAAEAAGLPVNPQLKPSGLDWLDDVPAHWKVLPLKRVSQISYGVGGEIDRSLEEGLKTLSLPNIDFEGNLNLNDVPHAQVSETEKRTVLLRKGDLLFNWRNGSSDHLGKTAYFDADGDYSHVSFLLRIRFEPEIHCSKFFRYLLGGYRVTGFFKHSKAGVNNTFNLSELSALPVMFPPLPEQAAIAIYLDSETAKVAVHTSQVATARV